MHVDRLIIALLALVSAGLVLVAVTAANSDSGAGYLHLFMLWLSGFIASLLVRAMFKD